jgi:citrate lyase subunit beta / citryl-CoA lyase
MEPLRSWLDTRDPLALATGADVLCLRAGDADWACARGRRIAARISPLPTATLEAELDALLPLAPWAVMLPQCRGGADLQRLGAKLAVREARLGLAAGSTRIVAAIDGAVGVLSLASFAGASPRLAALVADAAALEAEFGASRESGAVALARGLCVVSAAAASVPAIDGARNGPFNPLMARGEAMAARAEGFRGKIATHPEEAAIYNEVFAVSP